MRMETTDVGKPSSWVKYRPSLCDDCRAHCCQLPVEVSPADLVRMGLATTDEAQGSLKKLAKKLMKARIIQSFKSRPQLLILEQKPNGDCLFLGVDRRCTIYETRPQVCRNFPEIGPRPGFCPSLKKKQ